MGDKVSRGEWSSMYFDLPMFQKLNWNKPSFWCSSLGEAVLSRAPVLSFHSRGCYSLDRNNYDGAANMCPRHLKKLVQALDRLTIPSVKEVIKVALLGDTAHYKDDGAKILKEDKDKYRCYLAARGLTSCFGGTITSYSSALSLARLGTS